MRLSDKTGALPASFGDRSRITRAGKAAVSAALRKGEANREDVARRFGLSPFTVADWAGDQSPVRVKPDPARRKWLTGMGLQTQALDMTELLIQERDTLVSPGAIIRFLGSGARSKLVPVLICKARKIFPYGSIRNAHGVGFKYVGKEPWSD